MRLVTLRPVPTLLTRFDLVPPALPNLPSLPLTPVGFLPPSSPLRLRSALAYATCTVVISAFQTTFPCFPGDEDNRTRLPRWPSRRPVLSFHLVQDCLSQPSDHQTATGTCCAHFGRHLLLLRSLRVIAFARLRSIWFAQFRRQFQLSAHHHCCSRSLRSDSPFAAWPPAVRRHAHSCASVRGSKLRCGSTLALTARSGLLPLLIRQTRAR